MIKLWSKLLTFCVFTLALAILDYRKHINEGSSWIVSRNRRRKSCVLFEVAATAMSYFDRSKFQKSYFSCLICLVDLKLKYIFKYKYKYKLYKGINFGYLILYKFNINSKMFFQFLFLFNFFCLFVQLKDSRNYHGQFIFHYACFSFDFFPH